MNRIYIFVSIFLCLTPQIASAIEHAEDVVTITKNETHGDILTDSHGKTLYIFTPDQKNESTCHDKCAVLWPPLIIEDALKIPAGFEGKLEVAERRDGTRQISHNGKPLYYFFKDKKPGDTTGHGVGGKWFVAKP